MKKLNKFFAVLVALAMMATLCVSMAFAVNPATSTTPGEGVDTKVKKVIEKPDGLSGLPTTKDWQFTVTNTNSDIGNTTITLTDNTKLTSDDILAYAIAAFDSRNADEDTTNDLAPGKYEFTVKEVAPEGYSKTDISYDTGDAETAKYKTTETYTYSKAEYKVTALIATDTAANGDVTYYVQSAAVQMIKDDNGDAPAAEDAKPTGGNEEDAVVFDFTNKYNKKVENLDQTQTTEENDPTTLKIKKTVTDTDLTDDKTPDPEQQFKFRATINFPENSTESYYDATVKDANGVVAGAEKVRFTDDAVTVFTLKAGQYLSFDKIEIGAVVTSLQEDTYPGYTTDDTFTNGTTFITDAATGNAITVDNEWDANAGSLTGILMSNIPYIVLALVAIGGLCAYVVVRRKNADEA